MFSRNTLTQLFVLCCLFMGIILVIQTSQVALDDSVTLGGRVDHLIGLLLAKLATLTSISDAIITAIPALLPELSYQTYINVLFDVSLYGLIIAGFCLVVGLLASNIRYLFVCLSIVAFASLVSVVIV